MGITAELKSHHCGDRGRIENASQDRSRRSQGRRVMASGVRLHGHGRNAKKAAKHPFLNISLLAGQMEILSRYILLAVPAGLGSDMGQFQKPFPPKGSFSIKLFFENSIFCSDVTAVEVIKNKSAGAPMCGGSH